MIILNKALSFSFLLSTRTLSRYSRVVFNVLLLIKAHSLVNHADERGRGLAPHLQHFYDPSNRSIASAVLGMMAA